MPSDVTGFRTLVLLTCLATVDLCYFQAEIDNLLLIENLGSGIVRPRWSARTFKSTMAAEMASRSNASSIRLN
jgi:hypothetical protein